MRLEVQSWSEVPQGSGLGTSSILAGCVLKSISAACGVDFDNASLVHAVLKVEQMLTTGGGWQDQAGGLYGGVKLARSDASLPLRVVVETLKVTPEALAAFEAHTILVFTGRARLARNLLQNVVRRWYARLPDIVSTVSSLRANAEEAASAFKSGDIKKVGACLREYWSQKENDGKGLRARLHLIHI